MPAGGEDGAAGEHVTAAGGDCGVDGQRAGGSCQVTGSLTAGDPGLGAAVAVACVIVRHCVDDDLSAVGETLSLSSCGFRAVCEDP